MGANRDASIFGLIYSATMILISGYSPVIRSKIINRWQSLEEQVQQPVLPKSYSAALRELADITEKNETMALSIEAKDKYILASNEASIKAGEILVRQFAKSIDFIDVGQNKMFEWLKVRGFLMQSNEPYQEYVNRGWFSWKPTKEKCNGEFRYTVRITPRGKVKLTSLYMDSIDSMALPA